MPGPKPLSLSASPEVKNVLEQFARSRKLPAWLVRRCQMLQYMLNGATNSATDRQFQCHIDTPRKWRKRWLSLTPSLQQLAAENEGELESLIAQLLQSGLRDEARPGSPATFTPEQVAALYALACEDPKLSGHSFEQWSTPELAREMVKRGLVETISAGSIWRFLKRGGNQTSSQSLLAQPAGKRARRV